MFIKINFFLIFSFIFKSLISNDGEQLLQDHCPLLYNQKQTCQNLANKFQEELRKYKSDQILTLLDQLQKSNDDYENLQKEASNCRAKSTPLCKEQAKKVFDSLTAVNGSIKEIMTILNRYFPQEIPAPITKEDNFDGFPYMTITNYDVNNFNNVLDKYLDSPYFNKGITTYLKQLSSNNKNFTANKNDLEECLKKVSVGCESLTKKAYETLNNINLLIAQIMEKLADQLRTTNPGLIDKPIKKQVTLPEGYQYTQITNFDGDTFSKAIKIYRDSLVDKQLVLRLEDCQKIIKGCQENIKTYSDEQKKLIIPQLIANISISFGEFILVERVFLAFGVPGLASMTAALIITSIIPGLDEFTEKIADWLIEGLFGLFTPRKLNIPTKIILPEISGELQRKLEFGTKQFHPEIG